MRISLNNYNYNLNNVNFSAKKKSKPKKYSQEIHFSNACLIRVGEDLDQKKIIELIQKQKLEFLSKQSNNITKWKYQHNEKDYMVVYNKHTKRVVSILPYKEGMENEPLNKDNMYWWLLENNNLAPRDWKY